MENSNQKRENEQEKFPESQVYPQDLSQHGRQTLYNKHNIDERKYIENQYGVTWLPAMVESSEQTGNHSSDTQRPDKISTNLFPQQFSVSSSTGLYGLFMGPSTMLPLDSIPLYGFTNYSKESNDPNREQVELNESIQNLVKSDRGDMSNEEGIPNDTGDQTQANKETIYCAICQKYMKTVHELQGHILIEHSEHAQSSFIGDGGLLPPMPTCPSCKYELRKVNSYEHEYSMQETIEDENAMTIAQSTGIFMVCDGCGKEFTLGLAPDTSQNSSTGEPNKRHFCEHCEKSYKHNRDLRKHLRTHHGVESSQPTNFSQTQYSPTQDTGGTQINQETTPPQTHKMTCQQCKKMFRGPFELRRHILTVHENKRPYKCSHCSKLFRDAYELKRHSVSHQRIHYQNMASSRPPTETLSSAEVLRLQSMESQGEIPGTQGVGEQGIGTNVIRDVYPNQPGQAIYPPSNINIDLYCTTCEKNFRGANEFKRHYSVVHEKKYRYKCIHCGKLWRDQYDLKRHCRRSHFVDREIDRAFIRKCLLDNTTTQADSAQQMQRSAVPIPNYDISQHMTLTLNHEAAAAIFGSADQDGHNTSSKIDPQFNLIHTDPMNIPSDSHTAPIFQNLPSISAASMMYHSQSDQNNNLIDSIIQSQNVEDIQEETKNAVNWSNFESDIRVSNFSNK